MDGLFYNVTWKEIIYHKGLCAMDFFQNCILEAMIKGFEKECFSKIRKLT